MLLKKSERSGGEGNGEEMKRVWQMVERLADTVDGGRDRYGWWSSSNPMSEIVPRRKKRTFFEGSMLQHKA